MTDRSKGEQNRAKQSHFLIETRLQILIGRRQFQIVEHGQKDERHRDAHHEHAEHDEHVLGAIDVNLGGRAEQWNARYVADYAGKTNFQNNVNSKLRSRPIGLPGDQRHRDGERAHLAAAH